MKKEILLLCICAFFMLNGNGQTTTLYDGSNSDMADSNLESVAVDSKGQKWIGSSSKGLFLYDGKSFTTFNKDNSVIKGNNASPIFIDSKGNLWVAFSNPSDGLARFDGTQWTSFGAKDVGANDINVTDICEDKDGVLYFAGPTGILLVLKEGNWSTIKLPSKDMVALSVDVNDEGEIALGFGREDCGLLIYRNKQWEKFSEKSSPLVLNVVRAVKYTRDGSLIVGYGGGFGDGGFSVLRDGKWKHYNKTNSGVSDHTVRDIEFDGKDYWMATNNGLMKFDGTSVSSVFFRDGMFKNVILDVAIEGGTIWVATNFGLIQYVP